MTCYNCNKELPGNAHFCGFCGMAQPKQDDELNCKTDVTDTTPDNPTTQETIYTQPDVSDVTVAVEDSVGEDKNDAVAPIDVEAISAEKEEKVNHFSSIYPSSTTPSSAVAENSEKAADPIKSVGATAAVATNSYSSNFNSQNTSKGASTQYGTGFQRPQTPPPQPTNTAEVVKTSTFFWTSVVFSIPVVGLIMMLVWSFSDNTNPNKRNYSRAMLIWQGVALVMSIFSMILLILAIVTGAGFATNFWELMYN